MRSSPARQELLDSALIWRRIMDHHIEPEDAGRVFAETRPKMAVFTQNFRVLSSSTVIASRRRSNPASPTDWIAASPSS